MSTTFGAGFHAAPGQAVDASGYERWTGRWSRLFIPAVLAAAAVGPKCRVLDVSTGTGEAARMALSLVGTEGVVVGVDISPEMLTSARAELYGVPFLPVAADGQALPFRDSGFDAVVCQLGLQFFPDPARGVGEFRRVLRKGGRVAICVISTPDRAPMWGNLADVLSRFLPELRDVLFLSFALHDPNRLEAMLAGAGFRHIHVERTTREDSFESFADYWEPIEAGVGSMPQAYLRLLPTDRRAVREEVRSRLSRFELTGKLRMSVEMLIGSGRAQELVPNVGLSPIASFRCGAGHTFTAQLPYGGLILMPYLFAATGERILWDPTVLELGDVHATNYGFGMRFSLLPPSDRWPAAYGFVEGSRRTTNLPGFSGDRIFAGMLLQY